MEATLNTSQGKGQIGQRQTTRRHRPSMAPGNPSHATVMSKGGQPPPDPFYQYLTPSDFDERQKQVAASDVWSGLKEQTTAHGIPHIAHAKGPIKKAFWSIMTAATVCALMYNLSAITKSFFSYKVDVAIKLRHENELIFPAVTVCNMSPIKKSAAQGGITSKSRRKRAVSVCNDGWSDYLDNCYWASNVTNTYVSSGTFCQAKGGQLAAIKNNAEYIFVKSISIDITNDDYWIDLAYTSSTWHWSDGSEATFLDWAPGDPSQNGSCARITDTGYKDISCSDQYKFMCVKGATNEEPTTQSSQATSGVEGNCCCTCCFMESDATTTCGTCTGPNPSNAAHCAATVVPTAPPTTTTTASPTTTTLEPQPIPGSQFPERVQTREEFQQEEKLTETLADIEVSEKQKMGFTSADLILDCQYSGYTCDISEFSTFYNPILGNCYIFNSGWDNRSLPLKKSLKAGRRHGLHLIINIDQSEYVKEVGDTAGLRLVVHPQGKMPFPEDEGITISPGHATSIGMKQATDTAVLFDNRLCGLVELDRKGRPYSECIDPGIDRSDLNIYEELYSATNYSANACQRTCYQKHCIKECGCGDSTEPMRGNALGLGTDTVKACDSSNITQDDCKYKVRLLYNNNSLDCNCPDSCKDTAYSVEVSLGEWPSNVQKESLLQKLAPKIGDSFDINDPDEYKENLIKVEVYYEEFNFEYIMERPSYPSSNYLSDIGGVLGLWVGFSILTIFEFVEFGMDLLVLATARCKGKRQLSQCTPTAEAPPVKDKKSGASKNWANGHDGVKVEQDEFPNSAHRPPPLQLQELISDNPSREMSTGHSTPEMTGLPEPGGMSDVGTAPKYNKDHSPPPPYSTGTSMSQNTPRQIFLKL